jgi:uncharacterized protein YndB with AHSA1/START domain
MRVTNLGDSMAKKIGLTLLVLLAALFAYAATKPDTFTVQRSTSIKAPPEKIYPLISDFHRWTAWSPYEKMDTTMKKTYTGSPSGVGAVYEWEGNSNVGKGRMEMVEATPSKVGIKLDFLKPFESHNRADFTLEPKPDSTTTVTWSMHGPNMYIGKVMSIFMSMDQMIGRDFETGLANLKAIAER